jgi:hypothetical protein
MPTIFSIAITDSSFQYRESYIHEQLFRILIVILIDFYFLTEDIQEKW